jgi:O-antigen/teichoic acid export membrane protein
MAELSRKIVTGALGGYLFLGVRLLVSILQVPIGIRYFGSSHYGIWLTVSAIASYVSLARFGFTGSVVTLLSQNSSLEERSSILRRLFLAMVVVNLALLAFLLLLFLLYRDVAHPLFNAGEDDRNLATLAAFVIVAFTFIRIPFSIFVNAFAGLGEVWWKNIHNCAATLAAFAALLVTLLFGGNLLFLAGATGLANLLTCLVAAIHLRRRHPWVSTPSRKRFTPRLGLSDLIKIASSFFFLNFVETIIWQTDSILISSVLGPASVTPYAITLRAYQMMLSFVMAISVPLWPIFGELYEKRQWQKINGIYNEFCLLACALGGLLWIFGVNFLEPLIELWAGPEAYAGLAVSLALGAFIFLVAFGHVNNILINGLTPTKSVILVATLEGALNVALSLVLIRRFGIGGVALATLIARMVCQLWFLPWYIRNRTDRRVRPQLGRLGRVTVTAISFAGISLIAQHLVVDAVPSYLCGVLLVMLYVGVVWRLNPSSVAQAKKGFSTFLSREDV